MLRSEIEVRGMLSTLYAAKGSNYELAARSLEWVLGGPYDGFVSIKEVCASNGINDLTCGAGSMGTAIERKTV